MAHQLLVKPTDLLRLSHGAAVFLDRALPESPGIARVRIATRGTKNEKKGDEAARKRSGGCKLGAALRLIQRLLHFVREHYASCITAV